MYYLVRRGKGDGTGDDIIAHSALSAIAIPTDENGYEKFWSDFLPPDGYDPIYHQLYRGRNQEKGWWTIEYRAKQKYLEFDRTFRDSTLFTKALTSLNIHYLSLLLSAMYSADRPAKDRYNDFVFALQKIVDGLPIRMTAAQLAQLNTALTACHFPTVTALTLL